MYLKHRRSLGVYLDTLFSLCRDCYRHQHSSNICDTTS